MRISQPFEASVLFKYALSNFLRRIVLEFMSDSLGVMSVSTVIISKLSVALEWVHILDTFANTGKICFATPFPDLR